jgi:DNA-binding beta-propeller fold protein YncE
VRQTLKARALPALATAMLLAVTGAVGQASAAPSAGATDTAPRQVLFVGNNWDGTASVVSSDASLTPVGQINVIPDKTQRLLEIYLNPIKLAAFLTVRETAGEGHDQFADDMYTTPDGSAVVVSRPSFADVVSINLQTGKVNWRFPMEGFRADHMALSPDGTRVAVSDSTADKVHVLDIRTGQRIGSFATGTKPHENVFTKNGQIWNMSIGEVTTDLDDPWMDFLKGDRKITVADANTFQVIRTIDMRDRLDAIGLDDYSDAVRPAAFSPDESKLYFQVSFFNGFFEYDLATDRITRTKELPKNPATSDDRTSMLLDSRHHGLAMQPSGERLCVAGTMDDYATVVNRSTLQEGPLVPASKPYWATVTGDGNSCVISESGADRITSLSFATGQKITSTAVGDHPQRVRLGKVPADWNGVG